MGRAISKQVKRHPNVADYLITSISCAMSSSHADPLPIAFQLVLPPNYTVLLRSTDARAPAPASVTADAVFVTTGIAPNSAPLDTRVAGHGPPVPALGKLAMLAGLRSKVIAANLARTVRGEPLGSWKPIPLMAVSMIGRYFGTRDTPGDTLWSPADILDVNRDAGIGYVPGIRTKFGIGAQWPRC
ncbi:hypothetical protein GGF31_001479 [Allomyces arbusculus]|nr:hypothetical protein GGF31_001479 [Allomyces arbusculus]